MLETRPRPMAMDLSQWTVYCSILAFFFFFFLGGGGGVSMKYWLYTLPSKRLVCTVAIIIKFTFRFRSMIVLRCERGWKNGCEIVFTSYAPFLRVSSVVKFLTAYTRCSLHPTVFYLGYALDPGSLSLLVFVRCPQLLQNRRYSGNTIDH